MKLLTFAIPCYNSEAYMEKCIESLLPGGDDVPEVSDMVRVWYADQGYPRDIEYVQSDGQTKAYHVIWRGGEVAV